MKQYYRLLFTALLLLITSVVSAQIASVNFRGPINSYLAGATRIDVTYTDKYGTSITTQLGTNARALEVDVQIGTVVTYTVTHPENYVFRATKNTSPEGGALPFAPVKNYPVGGPYTTTYTIPSNSLRTTGPDEAYTIGLELIQQYIFEVKTPAGHKIELKVPNGDIAAEVISVDASGSNTDVTKKVYINKGGPIADLKINGETVTNADSRTAFKQWKEQGTAGIFGFTNDLDYNAQKVAFNASGEAMLTNAVLTADMSKQHKVTIKAPITLTPTTGEIGGSFNGFSYIGAPVNSNEVIGDPQSYTDVNAPFTTDTWFWVNDGSTLSGLSATPKDISAVNQTGRYMVTKWTQQRAGEMSTDLSSVTIPNASISKGVVYVPYFVRQFEVTITSQPNFAIAGSYTTTTNTAGTIVSNTSVAYATSGVTPVKIYVDYNGGTATQNLINNVINGTGVTRNVYVSAPGAGRTVATKWNGALTSAPGLTSTDGLVIAADDQTLGFDVQDQLLLTIGAQPNGTVSMNSDYTAYDTNDVTNAVATTVQKLQIANSALDSKWWVVKDFETTNLAVAPAMGNVFTGYSGTIYAGDRKTSIDTDAKFVMDMSGDLRTTIVPIRTLTITKPLSGKINITYDFGVEKGKVAEILSTSAETSMLLNVNNGSNVEVTYTKADYNYADLDNPLNERYFFKTWNATVGSGNLSWDASGVTAEAGKFAINGDATIQSDLHHQYRVISDQTTAGVFENGTMAFTAYVGTPVNSNDYTNVSLGGSSVSVPFAKGDFVWIQEESTDANTIATNSIAPYKFVNWTGNTNAVNAPTSAFNTQGSRTLGVMFVKQSPLTVIAPSPSSIEVVYKDGHETKTVTVYSGANQTLSVNEGASVKSTINFTPTAEHKASLKNWTVTPDGTVPADAVDNPLNFTMPIQATTITAVLNSQYRVIVNAPTGAPGSLKVDYKENGTAKSVSTTYNGTAETIWVDNGTYPKITATPSPKYGVEAWLNSLSAFDASTIDVINDGKEEYIVNSAKTFGVNFERQYKLTVNIPDEQAYFRIRFYRSGAWQTREVNHHTPSSQNTFGVTSGTSVVISAYTDKTADNSYSPTIDFVEWTGALNGMNQPESNAIFYPVNPFNPNTHPTEYANWKASSVQGFNNGGQNTILMNADRSVGAVFQIPTRKVVVNEIKNGSIAIDYTYAGVAKRQMIDAKAEVKTVDADAKREIKLTITPDKNYSVDKTFITAAVPDAKLTDGTNGEVIVVFPLNNDVAFSPVFNALFGELTVEPFVNGAMTLNYTFEGDATQSVTITPTSTERILKVDLGTNVTLVPVMTDYSNYELEKWIGNVTGDVFVMANSNEAIGASFRLKAPQFSVLQTTDDNRVKVEYIKHGVAESKIVDLSNDLPIDADLLSTVTLTALPGTNSEFVSWTGLDLDKNAMVSFVMNTDLAGKSIVANFRTGTHKVVVEAPANGSLNVAYIGYNTAGAQTSYTDQMVTPESGTRTFDVINGTDMTIVVDAAENYQFAGWKDGNMIDADSRTFTVGDDLITGILFINTGNNLAVGTALDGVKLMGSTSVVYVKGGATEKATVSTVNGDYLADQSTKVQLMAKAEDGYEFIGWTGVPSDNKNATIEVVMDGAAKSITPTFRKQTRGLTVNAPVNGSIEVTYKGYTTATSLTAETIVETVNPQSGTRVFQAVLDEQISAKHSADRTYQFVAFTGFDDNALGTLTVNGDENVGVTYENQARILTIDAFAGNGKVKVEYYRLGEVKIAEFDETTAIRTVDVDFDSEVKVSVLENIATATSHYRFVNWTGAEFGNNTEMQLSFLMNDKKSVGAKFEKITHKLSVEAPANGYIKVEYTGYNTLKQETPFVAYVNAQSGTTVFDVVCETQATVTATELNKNYSFANWTGAPIDAITDPIRQQFSVDKDYTIGTVFNLNNYLLTVTKPMNGKVKVEYFEGNVAKQAIVEATSVENTFTVDKSSEVKVQAIAESHFDFVKWTGDKQELNNRIPNVAFVMEAVATIGADFRAGTHTVTVQAPVNGKIEVTYTGYKTTDDLNATPSLSEVVDAQSGTRVFNVVCKEDVILVATPDLNYSFLSWSGTPTADKAEQTLPSVMDDHTVSASFDILKRNLVVAAPMNGTIDIEYTKEGKVTRATAPANLTVDIDTKVTLEAKDAADYDFVKWTGVPNVDKSRERVITFMMDDNMVTIGSLFRAETRKLTAVSPINGSYQFNYFAYKNDESADTEERVIDMSSKEGDRTFDAVMFKAVTPVLRTPATNYRNVSWTKGAYTDNTAVTVESDLAIGAAFTIQNRTLTVEKPVNGEIKVEYLQNEVATTVVVKDVDGLFTVDLASKVKITAMASANYDFVMWKNADQFANVKAEAVEFLMESNKTIGSYFRKETRKLTAQSPTNGSYTFSYYAYANDNAKEGEVELHTIAMPANSGAREFDAVLETGVTAISRKAATNYENDKWIEAFDAVADATVKAMKEPMTIGAQFKTIKHDLSIAAPKYGQISVDYFEEGKPAQKTLTEGQAGSFKADQGSIVLLSAAAIDDYDFVIWKGDAQFEKMDVAAVQLVIDAPKSINSLFRKETRLLTAQSPINGEYEFSYVTYKNDNSDLTETRMIKLTPYTGQRELNAVLGTEVTVLDRKAYTNYSNGEWIGFGEANKNAEKPSTTISGDLTIGTLFTLNNRNLTITRPVNGSVKVEYTIGNEVKSILLNNNSADADLSMMVDWATKVKLTAIADAEYDFLTWKDGGLDKVTTNHVEFMMESNAADRIETAIFRRQTRDLIVTNPMNGKIKITYDFRKEEGEAGKEVIVDSKSTITTFQIDLNSNVTIVPIPDVPGYLWKNNYLNDVMLGDENITNAPKDGTATFTMDGSNSKTLVVNFKAEIYTITFNSNNGSAVENVNYTIEDEVIFVKPTRDPYFEFAGWYDNTQFNGESVEKLEKGTTGDRQYHAKWMRDMDDLSIGRMWNHTLIVKNPTQDPLITNATFKWYSIDEFGNDALLDNGGKQYVTFSDNNVPNGRYRTEIYLGGIARDSFDELPIVIEGDIVDAQWRVYPTKLRVGESVNIETGLMNNSNLKVGLFTQTGIPVQSKVVETGNGLRVENIGTAGLYLIRVAATDGKIESYKIVVSE